MAVQNASVSLRGVATMAAIAPLSEVYPYQNRTLDTSGPPYMTVRQDIQQKNLMVLVNNQGQPVTPITPVTLSPLPANEVRH